MASKWWAFYAHKEVKGMKFGLNCSNDIQKNKRFWYSTICFDDSILRASFCSLIIVTQQWYEKQNKFVLLKWPGGEIVHIFE